MAAPAFLAHWYASLPARWRGLVVPYGQALGAFVASYAGATALLKPWPSGHWWSLGVPALLALAACGWLWRPWALLARNSRGELRRLPLLLTWLVLVLLGWSLRNYLRYRLGEVRDLRSVRELAQPGNAVFFRLHCPFYVDQPHLGRYPAWHADRQKGTIDYFATYDFACPLLASAADTSVFRLTAPGWLRYAFRTELGRDLTPGERSWRYQNFVARTEAGFGELPQASFTYLLRVEAPTVGQYRAVRASRLAPYYGSPLLLAPIRAPLAERGGRTRRLGLAVLGLGSGAVIFWLLVLPLRPPD